MKKISFVFVLLLGYRASAQLGPGAELSFSDSKASYGDTTGHVRILDFRAWSPLWRGQHSQLSGNIGYSNEHFSNFPGVYGTDVQGVSAGLSWTRIMGSRHMLTISSDIGLYSDFVSLDSRAIRERVGVTWVNKVSDHFSWGYGVEYRNQFYGNQFIPVVVIMYTSREDARWKLSGLLPYHPKLTYKVAGNHAISAEMKQSFSSYELTGAKDSGNYIRNQKTVLMLNYEYRIQKHWRIMAGVGYSLSQKYEVYNNSDTHGWYILNTKIGSSNPTPISSVSQKGVQFSIGIAFNPKF